MQTMVLALFALSALAALAMRAGADRKLAAAKGLLRSTASRSH